VRQFQARCGKWDAFGPEKPETSFRYYGVYDHSLVVQTYESLLKRHWIIYDTDTVRILASSRLQHKVANMSTALARLVAIISLPVFAAVLMAPVAIANSDESILSFRNFMTMHHEDLTFFLNEQEKDNSFVQRRDTRALQDEGSNEQQEFGQRCGNNHPCLQGMDCVQVNTLSLGSRCLPTSSCLEETYYATTAEAQQQGAQQIDIGFDVENFNEMIYQSAGYSKDEIFAALANARNERAFLETNEFQALRRALHENMEPLTTVFDEMSKTCIEDADPKQDATGSVKYIGLHIEVRKMTWQGTFIELWDPLMRTLYLSQCTYNYIGRSDY
jgi:hypothetical protein